MKLSNILVVLPLLALLSCKQKEKVDLLVYNANIYTVDSNFSKIEAIAIRDGKILDTGNTNYILGKYKTAQSIDANGNFVYPGLIDAHCHFMGYAKSLKSVNLFGTKSFEEVIKRLVDFQNIENLDFIRGRGWDQNDWKNQEFPNKSQLDELFPNIPVVLTRVDGHAVLINQAAIDFAELKDSLIKGGLIEKNENGELTGILIDNAVDLVKFPKMKKEVLIESINKAQKNCFAYGLTSLDDAGLDRESIELLDSLQQANFLKMRLYIMVSDKPELQEYYLNKGPIKTEKLNVSSFKFYADGALGSRGACLSHPYSDQINSHGFLLNSLDHFDASAQKMAEKGWQMNTHAIGDSANRAMLGIYGKYGKGKRWRIEHAQVLTEKDFELFNKFQVIPSVQPTHATSDMYWADERLGDQRIKDAYAYKRLLKQYGKIALGTDFPVEDISTIKTFYAATIRKDWEGYPTDGFQVQDALSREEALKGMTIWAAFANFEEEEKGSLEKGKMADFVIMNKDWINCSADEILDTKILHTYIGGEKVH
tara:strand:- start:40798 stop:42411 length:1614 start_codon:yes stop_codon:yes gene_type:complete